MYESLHPDRDAFRYGSGGIEREPPQVDDPTQSGEPKQAGEPARAAPAAAPG